MVQEITQLITDTSPFVIKSLGPMALAGIFQMGGAALTGILGASQAKQRASEEAAEKRRLAGELQSLESQRQAIINPYAKTTRDQSNLIQDLGGNLTNAFDNLAVATQAAEFQAEQADISLANTLDTLQASGASAGGATALAQAALASKKGIASSIEAQEAQNEKMKAEGESNLQRLQLSESQRVQGQQLAEGARVQKYLGAGEVMKFEQREAREQDKIDQTYSRMVGSENRERQANKDRSSAITGAVGGFVSGLGTYAGGVNKKAGIDNFLSFDEFIKNKNDN